MFLMAFRERKGIEGILEREGGGAGADIGTGGLNSLRLLLPVVYIPSFCFFFSFPFHQFGELEKFPFSSVPFTK